MPNEDPDLPTLRPLRRMRGTVQGLGGLATLSDEGEADDDGKVGNAGDRGGTGTGSGRRPDVTMFNGLAGEASRTYVLCCCT